MPLQTKVDSLDAASSNDVVVSRAPPDFMQESSVNDLLSQTPNDESHLCSRYLPFGHTLQASLVARSMVGSYNRVYLSTLSESPIMS